MSGSDSHFRRLPGQLYVENRLQDGVHRRKTRPEATANKDDGGLDHILGEGCKKWQILARF